MQALVLFEQYKWLSDGLYYKCIVTVAQQLLLEHVSKIVSILLSKLSDYPNIDTSLCYCNYPFLDSVYILEIEVCQHNHIQLFRP